MSESPDALLARLDEPLPTIGDLLKRRDPDRLRAAQEALQSATRSKLDAALTRAVHRRNRVAAWLINQEFSRRRVPPIFRRLPDPVEEEKLSMLDAFAYDLEWIATQYPHHKTSFQRWRTFLDSRYFHERVRFIYFDGRQPIYKVVKGLGLTVEQQTECHALKFEARANRFAHLWTMRHGVIKDTLRAELITSLLNAGRRVVHEDAAFWRTVNRRADVWLCANLANFKATRTALLYNALTGISDRPDDRGDNPHMQRNLAYKIIGELDKLPRELRRPK